MWSDFRCALWAMTDERRASEDLMPDAADGAFGRPPPDHILALVPHEAVPNVT